MKTKPSARQTATLLMAVCAILWSLAVLLSNCSPGTSPLTSGGRSLLAAAVVGVSLKRPNAGIKRCILTYL